MLASGLFHGVIMPTYAYHCTSCNANHETFQKISEEPIKICLSCGKPTLQRGPGGGIGLAFKGKGFYINDYGKGASSGEEKASGPDNCACGKNKCE
ncbi:hypothetical protein DB41_KI00060 [Neochlamydia sp. TUME1]|nr:FmdB family zinc ribbon protein [Neochlamydia sp. TUME1]KIC72562.1 hypothetical protein DB41_KI00060 [Neochlamydia sp. TUME1]